MSYRITLSDVRKSRCSIRSRPFRSVPKKVHEELRAENIGGHKRVIANASRVVAFYASRVIACLVFERVLLRLLPVPSVDCRRVGRLWEGGVGRVCLLCRDTCRRPLVLRNIIFPRRVSGHGVEHSLENPTSVAQREPSRVVVYF